jgi:hypothetical protein
MREIKDRKGDGGKIQGYVEIEQVIGNLTGRGAQLLLSV